MVDNSNNAINKCKKKNKNKNKNINENNNKFKDLWDAIKNKNRKIKIKWHAGTIDTTR